MTPSFASVGLSRWWDPADREEVRAANAEIWPSVRERLLADHPRGTALTDVPAFRDAIRDAAVHDGWGAADVAVWFGVSRECARRWITDVIDEVEVDDVGPTSWRTWALDRFVPIDPDEARALVARTAARERGRSVQEEDVAALRRFVSERGYVPRAGEFAEYAGASYQAIGGRWPGSYAEGWDVLYREAGYDRPGGYDVGG